jgi:transcriptional regulator with XRE-family HTH domain
MTIPKGFGERLKAERKRLMLSQTELAEIGGVGRLAQSQYESEQSAPTTRYLSAISGAGVNLTYLVLGMRPESTALTPEQLDRVESKAFEWVEIYSDAQSSGKLSAESRRLMYQVFRNLLAQVELGEIPADLAPKMFMSLKLPT